MKYQSLKYIEGNWIAILYNLFNNYEQNHLKCILFCTYFKCVEWGKMQMD